MLNGLDLFSGIGGITLGISPWVRPIAYCEIDRYAQAVLLSRMASGELPAAPIWDDVRTLRAEMLPDIEIVYGGFPCQGISLAGNRKGLEDERSALVFEALRLIEEIKPTFCFLENVPAIRTSGAERISKLLAALGYDLRWDNLSAYDVGAPHRRERWWLAAHTNGQGSSIARRDEISFKMDSRDEPELLVQADIWGKDASDASRMDDGVSPRIHRIASVGNSVVPQCAREAFKRLMGISDET
jgi:DNA (cytosine-5)-methyltransferase 1